jgi:hypothetical protein
MTVLLAGTLPARATITTVTDNFTGSANGGSATDGLTVSGNASFAVSSNGNIVLTLSNTSPETKSTNELLTGIDFTLSYDGKALTSLTYNSATAIPVTIASTGKYTDGSSTSIKNSWATSRSSDNYSLNFLLDNKYAIVGPPDSKTKLYDDANSSIYNGNSATNPFSADSATFSFSNTLITNPSELTISNVTFLYDTGCTYQVGGKLSPVPERGVTVVFGLGLALACLASHFSIFSKRRGVAGVVELETAGLS